MSETMPQSPQNKRQITVKATKSYKGGKGREAAETDNSVSEVML